jgi:hypothetical protein
MIFRLFHGSGQLFRQERHPTMGEIYPRIETPKEAQELIDGLGVGCRGPIWIGRPTIVTAAVERLLLAIGQLPSSFLPLLAVDVRQPRFLDLAKLSATEFVESFGTKRHRVSRGLDSCCERLKKKIKK